jgi:tetratricopeptide (TPR) repeat protein
MNCKVVTQDQIVERYAAGQLNQADTEAFEQHFFECENCYEALQDQGAMRAALSNAPREELSPAAPSRADFNPWWLLAAAVLVAGLGLVLWLAPWAGSPTDQVLIAASAVEAPPYEPSTLRSVVGEGELAFREAMAAYEEGDLAAAIPGLENAVALDEGLDKAHFYLGACYLLENRPEEAIDSLSHVAGFEDTPYSDWAHFYRAKAHLRLGDLDSALADLSEVISVGGELKSKAEEVLEQIPD